MCVGFVVDAVTAGRTDRGQITECGHRIDVAAPDYFAVTESEVCLGIATAVDRRDASVEMAVDTSRDETRIGEFD